MGETGGSTPAARGADARHPGPLALAALAVLAGLTPVVVAGALGATGDPDLALVLPLERALDVGLALAALLAAVAWPFAALAPGSRELGPRARGLELLLLAAGAAPGLRLAALLSAEVEASVARAFVALAVLALALGLLVLALARAGARRSTGVALGAALALALPFASACAREADLELPRLARGSPVVAVLDALHGEGEPWGLAIGLALAALAVAVAARARPRREPTLPASPGALSGPSLALALVPIAGLGLALTPARARAQESAPPPLELVALRPLLAPHDRPGELAPLRLELRAGPRGFEGEVGARGSGLLVLVPVKLPPLSTATVSLPAIGDASGSALSLEAWPTGGEPTPLEPPRGPFEPSAVAVWAPLPGILQGTPEPIARAIRNPRTALLVLSSGELDLLGTAGTALDVLGAPGSALKAPEARARLEAFAAAGGALALDDPARVLEVGEGRGAGPVRRDQDLVQRGLGAGVVLAPARPDSVAALGSELALRLSARARPPAESLADAVSHLAEPRTSPRVAGRIAVLGLLVAGGLSLVLVAQRRASPAVLAGSFGVAALALVLLVPWLVLRDARSPVVLETSLVLDAPSGGTVAGETALLRFASPRAALAHVRLAPAAPLAAVLPDAAEAARSHAELRWAPHAAGVASLARESAELAFPLGRTPALFLRRASRPLGGAVTLERAAGSLVVRNGLPVPLERPLVVAKEGVLRLEDVPPGGEARVDLAKQPSPFGSFLSGEVARASAADRGRWELLRAAFASRARAGTLGLTAFLGLDPGRQATAGVLEEVAGPVVLVVRE